MSRPLEGIKVIEVGQEIQGPFAGLVLADLGADVIKIENKEGGDLSRSILAKLIGGGGTRNVVALFPRHEPRQAEHHR